MLKLTNQQGHEAEAYLGQQEKQSDDFQDMLSKINDLRQEFEGLRQVNAPNRFLIVPTPFQQLKGCVSNFFQDPCLTQSAALRSISLHGKSIEHMPFWLRANPVVVTKAIEYDHRELQFASRSLRENPSIVEKAVKIDPEAITFTTQALQDNTEHLKILFMKFPDSFMSFSPSQQIKVIKSFKNSEERMAAFALCAGSKMMYQPQVSEGECNTHPPST